MDRLAIVGRLLEASRHVAEGVDCIGRQKSVIARLQGVGQSTDMAEELLQNFERLQAMHEDDRTRYASELERFDNAPRALRLSYGVVWEYFIRKSPSEEEQPWWRTPSMLEEAFNAVVSRTLASTSAEVEALIAALPDKIRWVLKPELAESGKACRYDPSTNCAYFLVAQTSLLTIWKWGYIRTEDEAKCLFALLAGLRVPMSIEVANGLYVRVTKRNVAETASVAEQSAAPPNPLVS